MIKTKLLVPAVALFALAGCQTNGDMYRSDVFGAIAGAALGAAGSSAASPQNSLVDGVQLTFKMNGRIFNSAQVGQMCEFKYGPAIMTSTGPTSTRIQPNNPYGCKR